MSGCWDRRPQCWERRHPRLLLSAKTILAEAAGKDACAPSKRNSFFRPVETARRLAFFTWLCVTLLGAATVDAKPPSIIKVEPPSWWAGHSINPVRLLIHGENLINALVVSKSPAITPSDVRVNERGTYLFVNLSIDPAAQAGPYVLNVETSEGSVPFRFAVNPPLDPSKNFQGINSNDCIYLIMIDRFSDGDPSNDSPAGAPPAATNRHNARAYHGGDLRGVINHLSYLKDLGVTAVWLTPWYDNWNGLHTCDRPWCPSTYYHGYHAIDYYGVEDHFGDMSTLKELVEKAHSMGLKVIQDQVANHIGSEHPWVSDPPLANWFHGTMQKHELNRFQNSVLLSPHGSPAQVRNTLDGWFSDDMPDMNQDEPEVARYEIQNSLWWVGMTGIDGIRQDTIQYIPRFFIRDLSNALHRQYPRMWMVGEVFERDAAQTSFFIGGHTGWDGIDTNLDSVFDFALWSKSLDVFTNHEPVRALQDQLKYDALYPDPSKITVFANNHDTARFMSLEGATLNGLKLHLAFILSTRGIPQLYVGEEIGMQGRGDPDNRRDFPGGFPGDPHNAFTSNGRSAAEQGMWQWTHDWINLRKKHSAIQNGLLTDLYADEDSYVFSRRNDEEALVVIINRSSSARKLSINVKGFAEGSVLKAILGQSNSTVVRQNKIEVDAPPTSAVAYVVTKPGGSQE
ncbi:MAG: alpha-amylase [Blastocatellia bacterium]|nr:MAG: alpha-amylase [Blastocatellia bacterium]